MFLEPVQEFYLNMGIKDCDTSSQFEPRILAIFHHPLFVEFLYELSAQSRSVVMNILVSGGVSAVLKEVIGSSSIKEATQPRFIQILFKCDWSGTDLETVTDFVLNEIEMGLKAGHWI